MNIRLRKKVAYHEAGHIVALYLLTGNIERIESVEVTLNDKSQLGCCNHTEEFLKKGYTNLFVEAMQYSTVGKFGLVFCEACYLLVGGVGQKTGLKLKRLPIRYMHGDFQALYDDNFIKDNYVQYFFGNTNESKFTAIDKLINAGIDYLNKLFENPENWKLVKNIAAELMKHDIIPQWKIYKLLGNEELSKVSKTKYDNKQT